jgi:hypothetical protein
MRNKKPFVFDEEKDAEEIIRNGFPNNLIDYSQMYLVAKYFRHILGYGTIRLEKELIIFCKTNDKNFNPITEAEAIKKWIKSAMNYGLRKINNVTISEEEVEWLKLIKNEKHKKILFITLVLSKALKGSTSKINSPYNKDNPNLSKNYYIRYSNLPDIIRLSKITSLSETDLANIFCDYGEYFTFYNPEKELIKLEYIKETPDSKMLTIDLENILAEYEVLFGKNIRLCDICKKPFSKNSNRQKTCPSCSKEIIKEKDKERKRKERAKPVHI